MGALFRRGIWFQAVVTLPSCAEAGLASFRGLSALRRAVANASASPGGCTGLSADCVAAVSAWPLCADADAHCAAVWLAKNANGDPLSHPPGVDLAAAWGSPAAEWIRDPAVQRAVLGKRACQSDDGGAGGSAGAGGGPLRRHHSAGEDPWGRGNAAGVTRSAGCGGGGGGGSRMTPTCFADADDGGVEVVSPLSAAPAVPLIGRFHSAPAAAGVDGLEAPAPQWPGAPAAAGGSGGSLSLQRWGEAAAEEDAGLLPPRGNTISNIAPDEAAAALLGMLPQGVLALQQLGRPRGGGRAARGESARELQRRERNELRALLRTAAEEQRAAAAALLASAVAATAGAAGALQAAAAAQQPAEEEEMVGGGQYLYHHDDQHWAAAAGEEAVAPAPAVTEEQYGGACATQPEEGGSGQGQEEEVQQAMHLMAAAAEDAAQALRVWSSSSASLVGASGDSFGAAAAGSGGGQQGAGAAAAAGAAAEPPQHMYITEEMVAGAEEQSAEAAQQQQKAESELQPSRRRSGDGPQALAVAGGG